MTETKYLAKITPFHAPRPKFRAMLQACLQPLEDLQAFVASLPAAFDIDYAIGVQLDAVGERVGRSRVIPVPVPSPWFAWDDASHGWDRSPWRDVAHSLGSALIALDDDNYRRLLKAKVKANSWDGTAESAQEILRSFVTFPESIVFCEDVENMEMINCISGQIPPIVDIAIIWKHMIGMKPPCVHIDTRITSVNGAPIFGFDISNDAVSGWDAGAWGASPEVILGVVSDAALDEPVFWEHLIPVFAYDISDPPLFDGWDRSAWA